MDPEQSLCPTREEVAPKPAKTSRLAKMSARLAQANERVLPLFFPCCLLVVGVFALLDLQLVDSALLESANWKQNTIWCLVLLFGLLPPNLQAHKITWMGVGYLLAFFILGGANVFGTVKLMMSIFKVVLPVLILFQTIRLWVATRRYERLLVVLPLASLVFAWLLYPIEDQNIVQSGWQSLLDWSLDHYRDDNGFHTYVGAIGVLAGLTEAIIVGKYLCSAPDKE